MRQFGEVTEVAAAALTWHDAGCNIIPVRADGTKRPSIYWDSYITTRTTRTAVEQWFGSGTAGIGIVCGKVSGNLEMLELEGRATDSASLDAIYAAALQHGCDHIWDQLTQDGYAEWTPSGGLHFLYRISDHEVPGNTKIARRPATAQELEANPGDRIKVLSETRGEGGFVVVAPSGGTVHPTGDSWSVCAGSIGVIPTITWQDRENLVTAIHAALDQMPQATAPAPRPKLSDLITAGTMRPGDDYNQRATWQDILQPHGWQIHHLTNTETYWTRPGKNRRDGHSATTGRATDADRLYVFTSATVFEPETPYTKFAAYCVAPETKILTADLRWVPAGSLLEGDEIVGVDEFVTKFRGRRKMRTATVLAAEKRTLPCYEVELEDGRIVTCSDQHPWLARSAGGGGNTRWIQTQNLRPGQIICSVTNGTWETAEDFDSGWLSGMYDGEGWTGAILGLAQKPGPILDRAELLLKERGFNPKRHMSPSGVGRLTLSDLPSMLRLLGTLQPHRLVAKRSWEGRACWTEIQPKAIVKEVRSVGHKTVAAFSTNTQTFIAEGLISHNTLLEHNGDFATATRTLRAAGYGAAPAATAAYVATPIPATAVAPQDQPAPHATDLATVSQATQVADWNQPFSAATVSGSRIISRKANYKELGRLFADGYRHTFRYVPDTKRWLYFNGKVWTQDRILAHQEAVKCLLDRAEEAAQAHEAQDWLKWLQSASRAASPDSLIKWCRSDQMITATPEDFDARRHLVTVGNGTYDMDSHTFTASFDPELMLTRQIAVNYDKDATAPRWTQFLQQVLPDDATRFYIQRAAGLTLLGDAQERALFLLHGKSGTGKSQFVRVLELLFGDYAGTATSSTFNEQSKRATVSNDLNDLRGKRFVSLSELDQDERLNEALVKRMTGGDTAVSRALYQENQRWRVEFMLWMATNYLPRLSSDDNAIWRRVKPIEFPNVAADNGGEVKNLAESIFAEEASGILNWLLDGVRAYQQDGLDDLPQITEAVATYRRDVDTVAQFIDAAADEAAIRIEPETTIPVRQLHGIYQQWCNNNGSKWLGERRFGQRIQSLGFERRKTEAANVWVGITHGTWMLGGLRQ